MVKALQLLTRSCSSKQEEAPYLLVHMHGTQTLELLLRCLSNIDEAVLYHACLALYALIQRSPPARILFLRKQGIAELAECLRDYNVDVKATSLRILCLLAAESDHARDEMRTEEVLLAILRTVQSYPAEDVNLPVLDAALEAIAHIVLSSRTNQDYIRSVSGLEPLANALKTLIRELPEHTPPPSPGAAAGSYSGASGACSAAGGRRGRGASATRVEPAATCGAPSAVTAAQSRPPTAGRASRPATAGANRMRTSSGSWNEHVYMERAAESHRLGRDDNPMDRVNGRGLPDYGHGHDNALAASASAEGRQTLDLWKVTETACDALNNVAYRNADNQAALLELGVLPACLTLLARHNAQGNESVSCLHAGALNLLINMADTNHESQDALGSADAAAAVHRLLCASGSPKIVCSACLLLSHVTWNHPPNQQLYGTEQAIRTLLSLLSPAGRAAAIGSSWAGGGSAGAAGGGGAGGAGGAGGGGAAAKAAVKAVGAGSVGAKPQPPPPPPPAPAAAPSVADATASSAGADSSSHASELTLYSMMALVNLSYCNERVQELVRACGGVPLIQQQLSSPLYEARKTAAFCLGNLVRDNSANARDVVVHGGVEALLRCLNDEDDDELSKTAYSTVQHLGMAGVQQLLRVIADAARVLLGGRGGGSKGGGRRGGSASGGGAGGMGHLAEVEDDEDWEEEMRLDEIKGTGSGAAHRAKPTERPQSAVASGGGSLFASRASSGSASAGMATGAAAHAPCASTSLGLATAASSGRASTPDDAAEQSAFAMLEVALPVLNGMVYTADAHGRAVLTPEGLGALLPLYSEAVPPALHEQATHVLFNCTSIKEDLNLLALAVREGAVEAMCTAATLAHSGGASDGLALAYGTLTNLAEGCAAARERFAQNRAAMELVLGLCDRLPAGSNEARAAAAELLLALLSSEPPRQRVLDAGGRRALEAVACASWSGDVLSARAKQALRELS